MPSTFVLGRNIALSAWTHKKSDAYVIERPPFAHLPALFPPSEDPYLSTTFSSVRVDIVLAAKAETDAAFTS
jgi:hypothetical protein